MLQTPIADLYRIVKSGARRSDAQTCAGSAKLLLVSSFLPLVLLIPWALVSVGQNASDASTAPTPAQAQALVEQSLAAELRAAQDQTHPMRYRLRKTSTRLTSTKEILETRDGAVARLLLINDKTLSPEDEQKEEARLDALLSDPARQRHRKQNEDDDTRRALKVLRALPKAFVYQFAGTVPGPAGIVDKFTFRPNPSFNPPDLETQALTAMTGELWIDLAHQRVTRLEGHLQQDVDFGWGVLGQLNKGGWIVIEQALVAGDQWRIVRFSMSMSGRVLFKAKSFDTTEEETEFVPVRYGMRYPEAIKLLRSDAIGAGTAVR